MARHLVVVASPARAEPKEDIQHRCTGVLVGPSHVLVSAYCVGEGEDGAQLAEPASVEIIAGSRIGAGTPGVKAKALIRHPNFDPATFRADIAVIALAQPIANAQPMALANFEVTADLVTIGWSPDAESRRHRALQMPAPRFDARACERNVRSVRLQSAQDDFVSLAQKLALPDAASAAAWRLIEEATPRQVPEDAICAGPSEGAPCDADISSALVERRPGGAYRLAGLLSVSAACDTPGVPGLYVSVAAHADWIRKVMQP